ncbi:MAG: hypothetical protein K2L81_00185, partial [Muribaculaceae bacterium]|nr:hypothetical protein [Muribaculaceae bacterium]
SAHREQPLIIMANGPSLAQTIAQYGPTLESHPTMAVNFAANATEFKQLRPRYYVLADPHFFNPQGDNNVHRLIGNLNGVDHEMTIFIPFGQKLEIANPRVKVEYFNMVGAEGARWLTTALYRSGRAMPRPRNVLIPAIMIGMLIGYKEIYLTGADHSWMRTLSVDDDNRVVTVQPHFYKDNESEHKRVTSVYANITLPQIIESFYIAFNAYHQIADFATREGVTIYNSTPESFIDAFKRSSLPE